MVRNLLHAKCRRDGRRNQRRIADRRKVDETDGRLCRVAEGGCGSERRLCLADAPGSSERDDPMFAQQRRDLVKLDLASNE